MRVNITRSQYTDDTGTLQYTALASGDALCPAWTDKARRDAAVDWHIKELVRQGYTVDVWEWDGDSKRHEMVATLAK